jgi:RND family efflux transporter MFP subunit
MKKKIVIGSCVFVGMLFTFFFFFGEKEVSSKEINFFSVEIKKVETLVYEEEKIFGGFAFSENSIDVASYVGSRIERLFVVPGQYVKKGELLAQLDDDVTQLEEEQARHLVDLNQKQEEDTKSYYDALVEEAKNALDKAQEERGATEEGSDQRKIADEGVDIARAQLESARELREQMKNTALISTKRTVYEQKIAQEYLQETQIIAPASGYIADVFYDEGDFAGAGNPLIRMISGERRISFLIPSSFQRNIAIGDEVSIKKKEGAQSTGYVREKKIHRDAYNFSLYEVEVSLREEHFLNDGEYAFLSLSLEKGDGGYPAIPREAVVEMYGDYFVYIVDEQQTAQRMRIESIYENEEYVWAWDKELIGESVITSSLSEIYPGVKISYKDAYESQ